MINACFFQEAINYTRNYFKIHVEFFFITLFTFKLVNIFILEMYACMCRLVNSSSYIIIEIYIKCLSGTSYRPLSIIVT